MMPTADPDRDRCFTEQLQRHHRRLYGYIFTLLRNHQDAQDVFQQTSLTLWEKFDEFQPETNFVTWACTVARFKAFDFQRRQRRYRAHFNQPFQLRLAEIHEHIPSEEFENRSAVLDECVEKLPPNQRALLRDCFGENSSVATVAKQLGRTTHSVYSSLRNIREKLLDCVNTADSGDAQVMKSLESVPLDVRTLLSLACDDALDRREISRLENVCNDAACARLLVEYLQLDAELSILVQGQQALDQSLRMIEEISTGKANNNPSLMQATSDSPFPTFLSTTFPATLGYSSGWPVAYLTATMIIGLGILSLWLTPVSRPEQVATHSTPPAAGRQLVPEPLPASVGRITGLVDCKRPGDSRVSLGQKFSLASGLMEITYDTGAKVILQGPVTYSVEANGGYLAVGKLTGKLEKRGREERGEGRDRCKSPNPKSQIPNCIPLSPLPSPLSPLRHPHSHRHRDRLGHGVRR